MSVNVVLTHPFRSLCSNKQVSSKTQPHPQNSRKWHRHSRVPVKYRSSENCGSDVFMLLTLLWSRNKLGVLNTFVAASTLAAYCVRKMFLNFRHNTSKFLLPKKKNKFVKLFFSFVICFKYVQKEFKQFYTHDSWCIREGLKTFKVFSIIEIMNYIYSTSLLGYCSISMWLFCSILQ